MEGNNSELEKRLWTAADQLRANARLKDARGSIPALRSDLPQSMGIELIFTWRGE